MYIKGNLISESPIYRGNARKTLFTRDDDGQQRLVSLAGEIDGTAQALMDAFIGASRNGRNIGLLNRLWQRLYDYPLPPNLIKSVNCRLKNTAYTNDRFFDMRMGLRLDDDRWASQANANYKYETVFRNAAFDFEMEVDERVLNSGENAARLYYLLEELKVGRFWFGAGKSKGLGRVRLETNWQPNSPSLPKIADGLNHLTLTLEFDAENPVLVGWNWGKVDQENLSTTVLDGRVLVESLRTLPAAIRERLALVLSGPTTNLDAWKAKLMEYLPRSVAIWVRERSKASITALTLSPQALSKLGKGKYALSPSILRIADSFMNRVFADESELIAQLSEALGEKANMAKRIAGAAEKKLSTGYRLSAEMWDELRQQFGFAESVQAAFTNNLHDEKLLTETLTQAFKPIFPNLLDLIDRQIALSRSDAWVDVEIANREGHLKIKEMLLSGKIRAADWENYHQAPPGVSLTLWREFLNDHRRVRYEHITNARNLRKSINNDRNFIAFLQTYRNQTRQELAQPYHIDYRSGGAGGNEISQEYGKPYDNIFMRMLSWSPSTQQPGAWEVYIPGSTLKGAFRKRATQVLRTLWGENKKSEKLIEDLFGIEGQIARALFSDAYLVDPLDPQRAWCSMDGVRMERGTGKPFSSAKNDYLFAYGKHLTFRLRIDLPDLSEKDLPALNLLLHLVRDFQNGDVPLGGNKTSGLGWVQAQIAALDLWAGPNQKVPASTLLAAQPASTEGIWQHVSLTDEAASAALANWLQPIQSEFKAEQPPRTAVGFISHRAFGGHSGMLFLEAEALSPLHINESGQPSYAAQLNGEPVYGWDFFSMSAPAAEFRTADRQYALPAKTLKGWLRHLYSIATDSKEPSTNLEALNPVDALFGWVGAGQNQAIMGRLSFYFGFFDNPTLQWYKIPYPYGEWQYEKGAWQQQAGKSARLYAIDKTWRIFPHTPLAPIVKPLAEFTPDTLQARYVRAVQPGSKAYANIRFWNLTDEELARLVWCVNLNENMAHKLGGHRYVGFGSMRLSILPQSYAIDWTKRYSSINPNTWQKPLDLESLQKSAKIQHQQALRQLLHVHTA